MKKLKSNKGITLITLVVTIIVMIVLATITISTLFGDHGIISEAQDAAESVRVAEAEEELNLIWLSLMMDPDFTNLTLDAQRGVLEEKLREKDSIAATEIHDAEKLELLAHYKGIERILSSSNNGYSNSYSGHSI